MPATAAAWTLDAMSIGVKEGGSNEGICKHNILEMDGSHVPLLLADMPKNIPTVVVMVPCVR